MSIGSSSSNEKLLANLNFYEKLDEFTTNLKVQLFLIFFQNHNGHWKTRFLDPSMIQFSDFGKNVYTTFEYLAQDIIFGQKHSI